MPFLTANWNYLAMLNFRIDPELLAPHVPNGTELDFYHAETYVSVVGFLFHHTLVMGVPIPGHSNFEEVNLRFYVRKKSGAESRRGVVFIRELVPKIAIAVTARVLYGEPYLAVPMRSEVIDGEGEVNVRYEWRRGSKWEFISMGARGDAQSVAAGTHEEFITEHYWGYTKRGAERTSEYRIEHPRWKIWPAASHEFKVDVATLYGAKFVEPLAATPVSAFIADGSFVAVHRRDADELSS
ncbi:MAG: YqjF family protein [Chthoniobacterales bacterium]